MTAASNVAWRSLKIILAAIGVLLLALVLYLGSMRLGFWNLSYEEVLEKHATHPSKFVMVDGVKLHVRDEGEGPVVLMLHSSMTNLRLWDAWADRLKSRYRVVRIDWPPYGLSVDPNPSQGSRGIVNLVHRFVEQEGLTDITLVGSSSGATLSTLYASVHPERVRALALSALPLAAPPDFKLSLWTRIMEWTHKHLIPNYYPRYYYARRVGEIWGDASRLSPETITWYYETNNLEGGFARVREYWAANMKNLWAKGAGKDAAAVTAPILLQWGDRDPVLPRYLAADAVKQFANAEVELIHYPDIGHYPMIERSDDTGADLEKFLDRVTAQAAAVKLGE